MPQEVKDYAREVLPQLDEESTRYRLLLTQKMLEEISEYKGTESLNEFVLRALNVVLFFELNPRQRVLLEDNSLKVNDQELPISLGHYKSSRDNPVKPQNLTFPQWRKELAQHFADLLGINLADYIRRAVEIRIEAYKIVMEEGGITSPDLVFGLPFSKSGSEYLIIS